MNYDDDTLTDIEMKANQARTDPDIDFDTQVHLWKESMHVRRKNMRDLSTS